MWACRRPQLVTVCAARIIIMCFIWDCARPAVRNHLRCSYCPNTSIYCIVFPSSCFTGLKDSTYTHTHRLVVCLPHSCFLAFVSTCVKLQNQSIRLRIRNIYKYLMLSFIRIFSVKPSPVWYCPPLLRCDSMLCKWALSTLSANGAFGKWEGHGEGRVRALYRCVL